jgi:aminomethyltransferase
MVPFAGFDMPVSYSGIIEEHTAVRERAGLFDVSHMGEFIVRGPDTWRYLDSAVTNNCAKLPEDGVLYTVMCRDDGTVVDDLLVSRLGDDEALVVVNAANIDKDYEHMAAMLDGDVELENRSDDFALLAVQGPRAREILKRCATFAPVADRIDSVRYYRHFTFASGGDEIRLSRTGYTGELGFEVFVPPARAGALWEEILAAGDIAPVGLAARDTLRFEAAFCLYGHELDDTTSPLEAGLRWVVKFKKGDFRGREALLAQKQEGTRKRLVGLELDGRNIGRQGYDVVSGGEVVGTVTSGTFSPTLRKSLALAYVAAPALEHDADFAVRVRNRDVRADRVDIPFYPSRAAGA